MPELIAQRELTPASYPEPPVLLSDKAMEVDSAMIWKRIEIYIAHRWTPRTAVWTVEGAGEFQAPLTPITGPTLHEWQGSDTGWVQVTIQNGPYGIILPDDGPYEISAQAGNTTEDVPADVLEAYRRLAEYFAGGRSVVNEPGASKYSFKVGGEMEWDVSKNAAWIARALVNSGAADLLRSYRRAY